MSPWRLNSDWCRILNECFQKGLVGLVSAGQGPTGIHLSETFLHIAQLLCISRWKLFQGSALHCNHDRPTWQTKRQISPNIWTAIKEHCWAVVPMPFPTHLLLKKGCQKIPYISVYVSEVTVSSSFRKYYCRCLWSCPEAKHSMGLKSKCLFPCAYRSLTDLLLAVPVRSGDADAHRGFTTTHVVQLNTKAPYLLNLASLLLRTT